MYLTLSLSACALALLSFKSISVATVPPVNSISSNGTLSRAPLVPWPAIPFEVPNGEDPNTNGYLRFTSIGSLGSSLERGVFRRLAWNIVDMPARPDFGSFVAVAENESGYGDDDGYGSNNSTGNERRSADDDDDYDKSSNNNNYTVGDESRAFFFDMRLHTRRGTSSAQNDATSNRTSKKATSNPIPISKVNANTLLTTAIKTILEHPFAEFTLRLENHPTLLGDLQLLRQPTSDIPLTPPIFSSVPHKHKQIIIEITKAELVPRAQRGNLIRILNSAALRFRLQDPQVEYPGLNLDEGGQGGEPLWHFEMVPGMEDAPVEDKSFTYGLALRLVSNMIAFQGGLGARMEFTVWYARQGRQRMKEIGRGKLGEKTVAE